MIETGVVFDRVGNPLYWHEENGRTAGSIPDSEALWNYLWEHREGIVGFAHSHPGSGAPAPSQTDVQTFSAVERALGKRLYWPIVTRDQIRFFRASGTGLFDYVEDNDPVGIEPHVFMILVRELRRRSHIDVPVQKNRMQRLIDWCVRLLNS